MRNSSGGDSPKTPPTQAARQATQRHSRSPAVHSAAWQPPPVRHAALPQCPRRQQSVDLRSNDEVYNEHQYLVASLQRQDERTRALLGTLCSVQTEQQLPQSSADARRLRKDAGFVQSKIAEAEQQERLILARLIDVWCEMQRRNRLGHLQYLQLQRQQQLQQQQQVAREQTHCNLGDPLQLWIPTSPPVKHTTASLISPLAPAFRSRYVLDAESSGPAEDGLEDDNIGCTVYHFGKPAIDETDKMEERIEKDQKDQKDEDPNASQSVKDRSNHGVDDDLYNSDSAPKHTGIRRCASSTTTDSLQDKQKRMSLPSLRSVWPDGST